jgi:hypothetical protein
MLDQGPGSLPWVDERGGRGRRMVKSYLPVLIIGRRSDGCGSFLRLVLFRLVAFAGCAARVKHLKFENRRE